VNRAAFALLAAFVVGSALGNLPEAASLRITTWNRSIKIDVAATAGTQHTKIEVVCDEATRSALIEGREKFLTATKKPQPERPKLQPGVPIGATHAPEDPKITFMKSLEGCFTDDQILVADLGRFGNTD
jgi:hypothetical protein